MSAVDVAAGTFSGNPASDVFEREWRTYRKMVDNNYLFHREAYRCLREIVTEQMLQRPFRFLDIACGDASATVAALAGSRVAQYSGIDLSDAALAIAADNLRALDCPVELVRGDFADVLAGWPRPVDVAWIGLSLHHLLKPEKLAVMRHVHRIVCPSGLLLIYENASPDGEDRASWLRRWDLQESVCAAYTPEEWSTMTTHVHGHDLPETDSGWHELGYDAGFREVRSLFIAPTDLFRVYLFRP
jgi:SAM-dependent methyltransferase